MNSQNLLYSLCALSEDYLQRSISIQQLQDKLGQCITEKNQLFAQKHLKHLQLSDEIQSIESRIQKRNNSIHNQLKPKIKVAQNTQKETEDKMSQVNLAQQIYAKKIEKAELEIDQIE